MKSTSIAFLGMLLAALLVSSVVVCCTASAQVVPAVPLDCGGCKIAIEAAMREWQGKNSIFFPDPTHPDHSIEWPDSQGCGGGDSNRDKKAPPYPPDGFYGGDLCDPQRGAALVQALLDQMKSGNAIYPYSGFVNHFRADRDPEEDADYPADGSSFIGRIQALPDTVSAGNYCATFNAMFQIIADMQTIEVPGVPGADISPLFIEEKGATLTTGGGFCGTHGVICFSTCGAGLAVWEPQVRAAFDADPWSPGASLTDIGIREGFAYYSNECAGPGENPEHPNTWTWCCWETMSLQHTRAKLRATAVNVRGSGSVYLKLGQEPDMNGSTNNPSHADNQVFHKYGSFDAPMQWQRHMGFTTAEITQDQNGDPIGNGFWGWKNRDRMVTLVTPKFPRKPDLVTLQAGSCSSCEPGEVKATVEGRNVNVLIGLGSWHLGSAGYILIRGDTIAGWGDEVLKPDGTLGDGASEMGTPASVFWRPATLRPTHGPRAWRSKEHRGYQYFRPKVKCDCSGKLGTWPGNFHFGLVSSGAHQGWTPAQVGGSYGIAQWHPTLSGKVTEVRTSGDGSSVRIQMQSASRVDSFFGHAGSFATTGYWRPQYVSERIIYDISCDPLYGATAQISFSSTVFPANRQYVGGKMAGEYLPTSSDFVIFMSTAGGSIAPMKHDTTINYGQLSNSATP